MGEGRLTSYRFMKMRHKILFQAATVLAACQAFAGNNATQAMPYNCYQGEPLQGCCPPAAYNAPASIGVNGICFCSPNWRGAFFADASFLYWYGGEEGLSLASNGEIEGGVSYFATDMTNYYQSFNYKPGFKIGFGFVGDREWVVHTEYTWLRGSNSNSVSAPSITTTAGSDTLTGVPVLLVDDWFLSGTSNGQALAASSLSSKWHYAVDMLDLTCSRPFYQGPCLTVTPLVGLEAAWIRQKMHVTIEESAEMFTLALPADIPSQPIGSRNYSNSWGLGPKFGVDANFLIPMGFRFEGDLAASLLYTQYTKISHSEDPASTAFNPGPYHTSIHNYGCLRPIVECGLGFGWGTYLQCREYHIDFSASYDFTYLWGQNMMRKMLDDLLTGAGGASSDLYFHGLTITGRFDF